MMQLLRMCMLHVRELMMQCTMSICRVEWHIAIHKIIYVAEDDKTTINIKLLCQLKQKVLSWSTYYSYRDQEEGGGQHEIHEQGMLILFKSLLASHWISVATAKKTCLPQYTVATAARRGHISYFAPKWIIIRTRKLIYTIVYIWGTNNYVRILTWWTERLVNSSSNAGAKDENW